MKSKCLTALIAGTMALGAHAQSSVQLWGRVGGGVEYLGNIKTGANTTGSRFAEGSQWGTSIWGIRGTEDLGAGNKALFSLEGAFSSANGNQGGGKLFQRAAWVALQNNQYGLLRLGQGNFINNYIWRFDPFLLEDYSASTFTNYRNGSKLANGIRYESPSFGGFEFAAQVNLGNSANGFRLGPADTVVQNGLAWGLSAAYVAPTWEVRAIYDQVNNQNGKMDNLFVASEELFVGGKAVFGPATVQAGWSHYSAPNTGPGLSSKANHFWTGLTYDVTPRFHAMGAAYLMKVGSGTWTKDHDGEGTGLMFNLGAMYDLSKSTFLYATVAHVTNSANANFSIRPVAPGYGDPVTGNGVSPAAGHSQTGAFVGVMHNF
ncbi:porin [Burkholderia sp. Nafp2/4-1b]|uniref:porin n=1 Tax=Burkholderia sp. Nafp2/4-1b TaxID=2116686 RepID=UPI000EF8FC31|nr:porin [Burkholderia sp. Nafp2/4-1b]RKU00064.1 porin [Burkholderia sp. Nafp2/4-1b]